MMSKTTYDVINNGCLSHLQKNKTMMMNALSLVQVTQKSW